MNASLSKKTYQVGRVCPQRAGCNQRSAGFSPLRLRMEGAVQSAQSSDRAVKRAEDGAPQISQTLLIRDRGALRTDAPYPAVSVTLFGLYEN